MTRGTRKSSPYSTTNVNWSAVRTVGEKELVSCDIIVVASTHLIFAIPTPSHKAYLWWRGNKASHPAPHLACLAVGESSMIGGCVSRRRGAPPPLFYRPQADTGRPNTVGPGCALVVVHTTYIHRRCLSS